MALDHPGWQQVRRPDQTGLVGLIMNGTYYINVGPSLLQQDASACDGQLSNPAGTQPAAHDNALGLAPCLLTQEPADDRGELPCEFLDRALHHCSSFSLSFRKQRIELFLADLIARLVAQGVGAGFAQGV